MGLFQTVLKDDFAMLPPPVRAVHGPAEKRVLAGRVAVLPLSAAGSTVVALIGLPRRAGEFAITVTLEPAGEAERWTRDIEGKKFASHLRAAPAAHSVIESMAGSACEFILEPGAEGILWRLAGYRWLGIPMPRVLWPRVKAREFAADGRYNFDVDVFLPLVGRVLGYRGWLTPVS